MLVVLRLLVRLLVGLLLRWRLIVGLLLWRRLIVEGLLLRLLVRAIPLLPVRLLSWEQGCSTPRHVEAMLDSLHDSGDGVWRYLVDHLLDLFH